MKVWKKVIAMLSVVIMCCWLIIPIEVNATSSKCGIHNYVVQKYYSRRETLGAEYYVHFYTIPVTNETNECRVELVCCYYKAKCNGCGRVKYDVAIEERERHINCNLSYQGLIKLNNKKVILSESNETVNVASNACGHNYILEKNYSHYEVIGPCYREHSFTSGFKTADDGEQIPIISYCNVDLVRCYYDGVCDICQDVEPRKGSSLKDLHKGCPLSGHGLIG